MTTCEKSFQQENLKYQIRNIFQSLEDLQKMRMQNGNRVAANWRIKLGQKPSTKLEDSDDVEKEAKGILDKLKDEHKFITKALIDKKTTLTKFIKNHEGIINSKLEFALVENYLRLIEQEEDLTKILEKIVQDADIYKHFLKNVKGCGPKMSAVIISFMDPKKTNHISSFWKYAGLDTVYDVETGTHKGRSMKKEHLELKKYTDKKGNEAEKLSITFQPILKSKLIGVLAGSFLKSKSPYTEIYYNYKSRMMFKVDNGEITLNHANNRALRYMIKMFLKDLWLVWRQIEGLEIEADYAEAKLGVKHSQPLIFEKYNLYTP